MLKALNDILGLLLYFMCWCAVNIKKPGPLLTHFHLYRPTVTVLCSLLLWMPLCPKLLCLQPTVPTCSGNFWTPTRFNGLYNDGLTVALNRFLHGMVLPCWGVTIWSVWQISQEIHSLGWWRAACCSSWTPSRISRASLITMYSRLKHCYRTSLYLFTTNDK